MSIDYSTPAAPYLKKISKALIVVVFLIGLLVMIGWICQNETLKRLIPEAVAVNPLSAICFLLCSISLLLQKNHIPDIHKLKIAKRCGLFVIIIGLGKFLCVIFGINFYLDTFLFSSQLFDPLRNDINEMAPNTAFCFFLGGLSLTWLDKEIFQERRPAQFFSIIIMFVAMLSIYGYVYGVKFLFGIAHYIPMSIITAINFLLLSLAILFIRPEKGSMAIVIGDTSAEVTLLRLAAFLVPLIFGWLKLKGEKMGYYSSEFGTALFAIVTYALALFLLGRRSVVNYRMRLVKKKAADELKIAHDRFLQFFDLSPEPKAITGIEDGRFLYMNKAYEDFFGIKSHEAIGKTSTELNIISPEKRNEIVTKIKEANMNQGFEVKLKNMKGEEKDTFINTAIIDLDDQQCLLSILIDITSRKQAEVELQQKEQLLQSIVDNIGEGLVVVDKKGKYLVTNHMSENILRRRPTDTPLTELSKKFGLFYPDGSTPFPSDQTTVARSLRGENTDELELFIRNDALPDGKHIVSTGRPIHDKDGNVIAAVTVFRDDTKRRELQSLLKESESKLNEVIRTIGEGIVMCNLEGKFILFNQKAEEIVGQGALDIPPNEWAEKYGLYHRDGKSLFEVDELMLMRALKGETIENAEILIRNKNTSVEKTILVSSRPVKNPDGTIIAAIADFRDVTEVRKLENLLSEVKEKYDQLMKNAGRS